MSWRRLGGSVDLRMTEEEVEQLGAIARSRTEAACRVTRARMLLRYRDDASYFAVGRALGVHHQTVQRCVERALRHGLMAALADSPRPGREPRITEAARAWLVDLACRKAKDLGYPHELWTTRLLARHARSHGPAAGHGCLAKLAQGTVCKLLDQHAVKPHKVRYYLERRDPEFEQKMAEVLCVYREVEMLKRAAAANPQAPIEAVAIISYDEKPGMQAIGTTAPDLPPAPGRHAGFGRDHEYVRHGTISLLAGHRSADRQGSRQRRGSPSLARVRRVSQTPRRGLSAEHRDHADPRQSLRAYLQGNPRLARRPARGPLQFRLHSQARLLGSTSSRASSPSSLARCSGTSASPPSRNSRTASSPPSTTSTDIPSSTPGPTN